MNMAFLARIPDFLTGVGVVTIVALSVWGALKLAKAYGRLKILFKR